jgi:hypothetical protein
MGIQNWLYTPAKDTAPLDARRHESGEFQKLTKP